MMTDLGKLLIGLGALLAVAGAVLWAAGRAGFRGLPGDFVWRGEGFSVYAPFASCLVLSIALTLLLWVVQRLGR